MRTYFCPRCGKKSSVLLKENQLCQSCMSKWAWGGVGNQVTITAEAVAAHDSKPAVRVQSARTSPLVRILPVVSLVCSAAVVVLLIVFFKEDTAGIAGQEVIKRYANIATTAVILAGLGFLITARGFQPATKRKD